MTAPSHQRRALLLALSAGAWAPTADAAHEPALVHERRFIFGSPIDIVVVPVPGYAAALAIDEVVRGLQHMNDSWHAWKPGDLSRLNAALRSGRSIETTPALVALIRSAALLERATLGHFNPAVGGLVGAWGFHDDVMRDGAAPRRAELAAWLDPRPSLAQIEIRGNAVRASNRNVQLDFGGYAKGVAIDWALARLRRHGIDNALVNLGGNLGTIGRTPSRPWSVGIAHPLHDSLLASLTTQAQESVVTSGSYERFRVLDGERRCHIIDPRRGVPAAPLVSVTVVHPCAALADAAATALLVAGPAAWRAVTQRMALDQVLVVDRELNAQCTARLAQRLVLHDLRPTELHVLA